MDPILYLTLITMVFLHISAKKNQKLTCWTPLAANRTPNRMGIRMGNRTCRQPLMLRHFLTILTKFLLLDCRKDDADALDSKDGLIRLICNSTYQIHLEQKISNSFGTVRIKFIWNSIYQIIFGTPGILCNHDQLLEDSRKTSKYTTEFY
jgi:hypothetical protein